MFVCSFCVSRIFSPGQIKAVDPRPGCADSPSCSCGWGFQVEVRMVGRPDRSPIHKLPKSESYEAYVDSMLLVLKWALIITFLVQYSSKFAFLRLGARLENSLGNSNTISGGKSAWLQQRQVPTLRAGTREDVTEWQHVVINCRERTRQNTWYNEIFLP